MSSGSYNVFIDNYNTSARSWSGADDPLKKNPNSYYGWRSLKRETPCLFYAYNRPDIQPWYSYDGVVNPGYTSEDHNLLWAKMDANAMYASAFSHLYDKVINSEFNAGVAIGEFQETLDAIVSLTRGTFTGMRRLKNGDVAGAFRSFTRGLSGAQQHTFYERGKGSTRSRTLQDYERRQRMAQKALDSGDVSSLWLAFQYAWKPLLSDISALSNLLDEGMEAQRGWVESKRTRLVSIGPRQAGTLGTTKLMHQPCTARYTTKYRAWVKRTPRIVDRVGLTDPLTIVWELVPFSFVVDWFIPIGDWLQNRSLMPFIDTTIWRSSLWYGKCYSDNWWPYSKTVAQMASAGDISTGTSIYTGGSIRDKHIDFRREIISASPPLPPFKALDKAFSLSHLENAAALIHQLFR